jgi:hypothetical protein
MVSDQPMALKGLAAMPLPEGVKPGRYFLSRAI